MADNGRPTIDARTVLIVDEAATVSDRDLHALLHLAAQHGTTIRFIGDPAQHGAVTAGGMWTYLVNKFQLDTPTLSIQRRLEDETEQTANQLARAGNPVAALELLAEHGNTTEIGSQAGLLPALMRRYFAVRDDNKTSPMIERRNELRQILNQTAQQIRHQRGEIVEPRRYGTRRFGVGDEIVAKRPNRALHPENQVENYVRNGSVGTVTAATARHVTVDFDGLGVITVPATDAAQGALDLSYAVTSYAVQGSTTPVSTSIITPGASLSEVVVNTSRGRRAAEGAGGWHLALCRF